MVPSVLASRPVTTRATVDLPAPLEPISAVTPGGGNGEGDVEQGPVGAVAGADAVDLEGRGAGVAAARRSPAGSAAVGAGSVTPSTPR